MTDVDLPDEHVRAMWNRRKWSRYVLMYVALVTSAVFYFVGKPPVWQAVLVVTTAVITALLGMRLTFDFTALDRLPFWPSYALLLVLCLGLALLGGGEWTFNSVWASAATGWIGGRWLPARLLAISAAFGTIAWLDDLEPVLVGWLVLVGLMVGFFTRQSRIQSDMFIELQVSRRERARLAVAEERDRIARDLHDLVGHSLSVIAVKTELARRLVTADPQKAEQELADIDTVVRRALSEVRQAVTNYRQPTLAGELASARKAAASAGIDCRVESPDSWSLPASVDGALAWTVREGVTNVLRHSRATRCTITLSLEDSFAAVAIADNGVGPGENGRGNGLAGLAERAQALGGSMDSGPGKDNGFTIRVRVPT
ncbi:two-component system, NarL family, sensor histidine kinase DesK [Kibdelosporangium aridum]|uniref:Two-component system, NarL family, sensor histidine kinase DesK n=1 Tax=Kibdelosporangium aridum TaxID=2030 RepID=A0A1W2EWI4_KIBAR|nr:two-component system, NarL family, sensor histidine kinase DesK [Kibdelosporangium aridum]